MVVLLRGANAESFNPQNTTCLCGTGRSCFAQEAAEVLGFLLLCFSLPRLGEGRGGGFECGPTDSFCIRSEERKPGWVVKLNDPFRSSERIESVIGFTGLGPHPDPLPVGEGEKLIDRCGQLKDLLCKAGRVMYLLNYAMSVLERLVHHGSLAPAISRRARTGSSLRNTFIAA